MATDFFKNILSSTKALITPTLSRVKSSFKENTKNQLETIKTIQNPARVVSPIITGAFKTTKDLATKASEGIDFLSKKRAEGMAKFESSVPEPIKPTVKIINKISDVQGKIGDFALHTGAQMLHDVAFTGELLSSKEGIKQSIDSFADLPKDIREKGILETLDEPSLILLTTVPDFFTGGGVGAGKQALKQGAKEVIEEGGEVVAKNIAKQAANNPGFLRRILTSGVETVEKFFDSPIVGDFIRTGADTIKKLPGGEELIKVAEKTLDDSDFYLRDYKRVVDKTLKNLNDAEFAEVLDVQRGLAKASNTKISEAASALKSMFKMIGDEAGKLGLEIRTANGAKKAFAEIENYVPQRLNIDLLKNNIGIQTKLANYLYETKQVTDVLGEDGKYIVGSGLEKAQKFVEQLVKDVPIRTAFSELYPNNVLPKIMGNLEMERILDLPTEIDGVRILDSSKKLITDYMQNASKRLSMVKNFGLGNELLKNFQKSTAGMQYSKEAVDIIKRTFGTDVKSFNEIMNERAASKLRRFESLTKLGTSAISNASQSVNTATTYGIGNTVKAIFNDFLKRPQSANFAEDAGILVETALRDLAQEGLGGTTGKKGLEKLLNLATAPGFKGVEAFNRRVAANTGKMYALDQFEKLLKNPSDGEIIKALEKFGVDVQKALKVGKLSEDDIIKSARTAVKTSQFRVTPLDIPVSFSSNFGRLLFQFKSFGYKQSEFIWKQVIKPALTKGDMRPLTRYVTLGVLAGEATADVKSLVTGKERPSDPLERAWSNLSQVGGMGIVTDALRSAGEYGGLLSWIAGPSIGDIVDITYDLLHVVRNPQALMKDITGKVPVFGSRINASLYPSDTKKTKILNGGASTTFGPSGLGY